MMATEYRPIKLEDYDAVRQLLADSGWQNRVKDPVRGLEQSGLITPRLTEETKKRNESMRLITLCPIPGVYFNNLIVFRTTRAQAL